MSEEKEVNRKKIDEIRSRFCARSCLIENIGLEQKCVAYFLIGGV